MNDNELYESALKASENAYAPYSHFRVGAAVLLENGDIVTGCNIENASYGATMCAERVALFKTVSEGKKNIIKIAVASPDTQTAYPCGMCLQVMSELCPNADIILGSNDGIKSYRLSDLLPFAFSLEEN